MEVQTLNYFEKSTGVQTLTYFEKGTGVQTNMAHVTQEKQGSYQSLLVIIRFFMHQMFRKWAIANRAKGGNWSYGDIAHRIFLHTAYQVQDTNIGISQNFKLTTSL